MKSTVRSRPRRSILLFVSALISVVAASAFALNNNLKTVDEVEVNGTTLTLWIKEPLTTTSCKSPTSTATSIQPGTATQCCGTSVSANDGYNAVSCSLTDTFCQHAKDVALAAKLSKRTVDIEANSCLSNRTLQLTRLRLN